MIFNSQTNDWRQPKAVIALITILLFGAVIITSILREKLVREDQWQVNVVGQGKIPYQPDIANISLGVKIDKVPKAEDALNQLNDKMNKVLTAIEKTGVKKDDVQTMDYILVPNYDTIENVSKLTGYTANQTVIIKAREIGQNAQAVTSIVSAANKAGANQINGITFEASGINDIKQEARLKAIADARSKAGNIANALGVKLERVVGWWENYIAPGDTFAYADGKGGMGGGGETLPNIPSGAREITIEVNLSYKIK